MDFSPLLILLFGGLVGWLFGHWRSADESAARRRDDQHKQLSAMSKRMPSMSDNSGSASVVSDSASGAQAANHATNKMSSPSLEFTAHTSAHITNSDASVNGVALTVIEQELDELYQLSAQVKPLEYELQKAREKLEQFKSIQEATSNDLDDTWVALHDELDEQDAQKSLVSFLSDSEYTVHVTSDESEPDEVGELYQLVGKVKPLQYELSRSRKSNNSLAADKERVERRLRSQIKLNSQQQETLKLELAKGLATQLAQKDARIAELQARVESLKREQAELAINSADMLVAKKDQQELKQQLVEQNEVLRSELKSLQGQSNTQYAESSAKVSKQKNELHSLQLITDDQKIQLGNANKRLDEINQKLSGNLEERSKLQKTIEGKDEQISKLGSQLDDLSQTTNTSLNEKNKALARAEKLELLLGKTETRTAELQVQQTQAEQQWRYEMSSLQALTSTLEESKAKASAKEATLERSILQGNSQRLALENRLKAAAENAQELEQALESSRDSSQSFSEYSKLAEAKVIQLSATVSEQESTLKKLSAQAKAAELQLQQRDQDHAEKYSVVESRVEKLNEQIQHHNDDKQQLLSDVMKAKQQVTELNVELQRSNTKLASKEAIIEKHATRLEAVTVEKDKLKESLTAKLIESETKYVDLNAALVLQQNNVTALERQIKAQEEALQQAKSGSQETEHSLSELEQKRLADAHKISELQTTLKQAEASAKQTQANSSELMQLEAQVLVLKKETSKYAAFQKDAQATALELLEAKELLKELDAQTQAAAKASDRLTSSSIENDRLQRELDKAKRFQVELQQQSTLLANLQSKVKQSSESQATVDDYQLRISTLEQDLKTRDAAVKTAQSQVDRNAKRDSSRIEKASAALSISKKRINELSKALTKAETLAKKANENDIELRRLRSELRTLQAQRDKSVKSLKATATDSTALKKLENDIILRDKKIKLLTNRLTDAQQSVPPDSLATTNKKSKVRSSEQRSKQARSTQKSPVLFAVPKEKDDLKRIKGIGPVMEKTLNSLGITSFKQIVDFSTADIERVSNALQTFPNRIEQDDWVGGAEKQYKIKYTNKAEA